MTAITRNDRGEAYSLLLESDGLEDTSLGVTLLVRDLAVTMTSVLREVALEADRSRRFVAKYGTTCGGVPDMLPIEFSLLSALNTTGLTPRVYYLSDATVITPAASRKVESEMFLAHSKVCEVDGSTARMLLMEKFGGVDLEAFFARFRASRGVEYIQAVLTIGLKSLNLVKRLHARGIVHGDIHPGNILFKTDKNLAATDWRTDDLVLIDLGLASFFPDEVDHSEFAPHARARSNPFVLSHWELDSQRPGRRDDVFRLFEMLAVFLSEWRIDKGIQYRIAGLQRMYAGQLRVGAVTINQIERNVAEWYKSSRSLFRFDAKLNSQCCIDRGLNENHLHSIQEELEMAMSLIRGLRHADAEPNYEQLEALLRSALATASDP